VWTGNGGIWTGIRSVATGVEVGNGTGGTEPAKDEMMTKNKRKTFATPTA